MAAHRGTGKGAEDAVGVVRRKVEGVVVEGGIVASVAEFLVLGDAEAEVGGLADVEVCGWGGDIGAGAGAIGVGVGDDVKVDTASLPVELAGYCCDTRAL